MSERRHRHSQALSLQERLLATAELAQRKAASQPAGPTRDALLRKAEQAHRTAAIEIWITSPGASFPE
jgi:hypothetical protein